MAKDETLIEKLRAENMELVKALESIKAKCVDENITAEEAQEEILKIIDETLNN